MPKSGGERIKEALLQALPRALLTLVGLALGFFFLLKGGIINHIAPVLKDEIRSAVDQHIFSHLREVIGLYFLEMRKKVDVEMKEVLYPLEDLVRKLLAKFER